MNRRNLILASLAGLPTALGFRLPVDARPRRPRRHRVGKNAKPETRRRRASLAKPATIPRPRVGLTASHVRTRSVTRTFSNLVPISIPEFLASSPRPALTYPSVIQVSGFNHGRIKKVQVGLLGLTHSNTRDLDIMLVAPGNVGVLIMSDAGASSPGVSNLTLLLDQDAPGPLPIPLVSGVFQPANYETAFDPMPGPAPHGVSGHSLTSFNNLDPNGPWQLFIADDLSFDSGTLAGWSLTIQAQVQVPHRHPRRPRRRPKRPA